MSARVTEKTKRGLIQFQKFQRFFRGQCPLRLARTSGVRDQPTAAGLSRPRVVAEVDGGGDLALVVRGAVVAPPHAVSQNGQMVRQRPAHRSRMPPGPRPGKTAG